MKIGKLIAILGIATMATAAGAKAGDSPRRHNSPTATQAALAAVPLPPLRKITKETPIVMGRSVSVGRKSRLRHIKAQPIEAIDREVAGRSNAASLAITTLR
jgi:hypothetical protein